MATKSVHVVCSEALEEIAAEFAVGSTREADEMRVGWRTASSRSVGAKSRLETAEGPAQASFEDDLVSLARSASGWPRFC